MRPRIPPPVELMARLKKLRGIWQQRFVDNGEEQGAAFSSEKTLKALDQGFVHASRGCLTDVCDLCALRFQHFNFFPHKNMQ